MTASTRQNPMDSGVGTMLRDIHGLLHEARANCEIPPAEGQALLNTVEAAESGHETNTLSVGELSTLIRDIQNGIQGPIANELAIDNPDAAVIQVRDILIRLEQIIKTWNRTMWP